MQYDIVFERSKHFSDVADQPPIDCEARLEKAFLSCSIPLKMRAKESFTAFR